MLDDVLNLDDLFSHRVAMPYDMCVAHQTSLGYEHYTT